METVHGTAVAVGETGVLLRGPSGCGKSDLALRLIDDGARLVADDRCILTLEDGRVVARAPATIRGRIEVRGVGIMTLAPLDMAVLALIVDLTPGPMERLPDPATVDVLGLPLKALRLSAFEASTPAKIRIAVRSDPDNMES